ncbi:hypothetical protein OX283_011260 [Flavobacterium sp. SUN052]|uniref:hypothetical protein n=1 Tax=Flavobacterium sp. SUN052 TaxID=3002441 RepID=UPI00237D57E5|nr:hypothetical protein [Flavobacterium sp. SUN052]MEC4005237.1 hypothetical protein [Flavobacterium sp. SUN052]
MLFKLKKLNLVLFLIISQITIGQEISKPIKYSAHNKGKIFFSFGGNRDKFSKSDIHFTGNNFDFTVYDAVAEDKPKGWNIDYINPTRMTIPQTNMKFGYFISDHYSISIGVDHMKYVFTQSQTANVSGYINLPASELGTNHNGNYNNMPVDFSDGTFLKFEHTNGLNYVNTEFARFDDVSNLFKLPNTDKFQINLTEGVGVGFLYPRTDATVLGKKEHDEFHIAGYGFSAKAGLNFNFFKYFFIQTELKGGYINMPDIQITYDNSEKASQHFMFIQSIISFGVNYKI